MLEAERKDEAFQASIQVVLRQVWYRMTRMEAVIQINEEFRKMA